MAMQTYDLALDPVKSDDVRFVTLFAAGG